MKVMLATLVVALAISGALATCPTTTACGGPGVCDKHICPNCNLVTTCIPNKQGTCPATIGDKHPCAFPSKPNGCGGTLPAYTCPCASGRPCDPHVYGGKCCPSTCSVHINRQDVPGTCASVQPANTVLGGQGSCPQGCGKCYVAKCPSTCTVHFGGKDFTGTCASHQPVNTILGGQGSCPTTCGKCYISSFHPGLCDTQAQSACARSGKCGCFATAKGASCKFENFLLPKPVPAPGNGGGCSENLCNALAAKEGLSAACCPQGCK